MLERADARSRGRAVDDDARPGAGVWSTGHMSQHAPSRRAQARREFFYGYRIPVPVRG